MVQSVAALRHKSEVCWFDSRWGYWDFYRINVPGVDSASNVIEYKGWPLGVKAAGA